MIERTLVIEAYNESKSVAMFRVYRNFQTWYVLSFDFWRDGKLINREKEYYDLELAFDCFDAHVQAQKMTVVENKKA